MNRFLARAPSIQPVAKEMTSEELDAKVAEFLRSGGDVKAVPIGASAYGHGASVDLDVAISNDRGAYNPINAQMKKVEHERRLKATRQRNRRPIKKSVIDQLRKLLDAETTMTKSELTKHMCIGTATLNRCIDEHFADDERVDRYRYATTAKAQAKREEELLAKVNALIESDDYVGVVDMAAKLGVSEERIVRLDKKHKLNIKRGNAWTTRKHITAGN